MHLVEHQFGDVTVLEFLGKVTLGEGDEMMKDKVNSLVASGHRKIVFDFEQSPYIDSSGLGELVRSYSTITRQGGRLVLARLSERIADLLAVTKLLTVYETYDSVGAAVGSFMSVLLEASCPICRPLVWLNYPDNRSLLSCTECDVSFLARLDDTIRTQLQSAALGESRPVPISHLWWITYYENSYGREAVHLTLGRPCIIAVTGRLDLWACDVLDRAWNAVPRPRRVLFDLTGVRLFSEKGRTKLIETFALSDGDSRAALLVHSTRAAWDPALDSSPIAPAIFEQRDLAMAAVADQATATPALSSTIRIKP